jgi:signal transduction histidine kinase
MHHTALRAFAKLRTLMDAHANEEFRAKAEPIVNILDESNRIITEGSSRVAEIVKRLRSFARLDEAERKTADIHEGLEDTLTLIHHQTKHGVTIVREYGELPQISCYPSRLNQVFLNLLVNAVQAMDGKGEIHIRTWADDRQVHIRIADTGKGISPAHLQRIFDPGFTTKGVGVGTGLGLSICYQIVQDHGGEITVESTVGEGTAFTLALPRARRQSDT